MKKQKTKPGDSQSRVLELLKEGSDEEAVEMAARLGPPKDIPEMFGAPPPSMSVEPAEPVLPKHTVLQITHNPHLYSSTHQKLASPSKVREYSVHRGKWISAKERTKAIEKNDMWEVRVYPFQDGTFYCILASSLEALLGELERRA